MHFNIILLPTPLFPKLYFQFNFLLPISHRRYRNLWTVIQFRTTAFNSKCKYTQSFKWNQLCAQFIRNIFINLYMFRATMCPSSEDTTVFLRHLVLVIMCGWLSGMQEHMLLSTRQSSTQNNKYQVSQKHSCISWWWAHSRPKHVEIDKYTKNKLCTKLILFTRFLQRCTVNKT